MDFGRSPLGHGENEWFWNEIEQFKWHLTCIMNVIEWFFVHWNDSGCFSKIMGKPRFSNWSASFIICMTWRRVLRTPLPLLEGVPQVMYGATTLDWCQLLIPLRDLNEINMEHRLYMYLDSCKGASLCMDLARSYASDRVRLMRADLWKIRISSFEVRIRLRIEVSEANGGSFQHSASAFDYMAHV